MKKILQELYINLDDSGKLTEKEKVSTYGGIVFLSKNEKDKFITQYRSIIKEIRCSYCSICNKKCPEIKNTNIKSSDKRRIMNYLKKYYIVGLIIKNEDVYNYIKENKAAKGRFTDYAIRRFIKEIIKSLIKKEIIDPNKPLKLIINIDQQTTKSNGYYNLYNGLIEELKYGINNYNYSSKIKKIINSDLTLIIKYQNFKNSYVIQAADLIAGTIRKTALENLDNLSRAFIKYVNFKIILP